MKTLLLGCALALAIALVTSTRIWTDGRDHGYWEAGVVACEPRKVKVVGK